MDDQLVLAKAVTLLYRESQIPDKTEKSDILISGIISGIKAPEIGLGINSERDAIASLKKTVSDMLADPLNVVYDKQLFLQRIRLNTSGNDELYKAIEEAVSEDLPQEKLVATVSELRRTLNNYNTEKNVFNAIAKAYHDMKYSRDSITDINGLFNSIREVIENSTVVSDEKDPAILDEVNISDRNSIHRTFEKAKKANNSNIWKVGWKGLARMTQGGFRSEFVVINALQHSYKTGFSLSIFSQLCTLNVPIDVKQGKKPAIVRYSFEDSLDKNFQFIYQYLKYAETREHVNIADLSTQEISDYVYEKLSENGWEVLFYRVDPTQWSYRKLIDHILSLEAKGYDVKAVMVDYLLKMPTVGCNTHGPMGSDKRDMFRRVRNFAEARGLLFITPQQLSSDVKTLLRGGMPEDQMPKEVAGKGYYDGCKTLDQETDLNIIIHLFHYNRKTYLAAYCDKHRLPTVVDEEDRYFILQFPYRMPIPPDREDEDQCMKKLNQVISNVRKEELVF